MYIYIIFNSNIPKLRIFAFYKNIYKTLCAIWECSMSIYIIFSANIPKLRTFTFYKNIHRTSCVIWEYLESLDFEISLYVRYVDDILEVIPREKIETILTNFNNYHDRLKFTYEVENNNIINFLNTTVLRKGETLITM